jgi:chromosome segregation ATPase
VIKRAEKRIAEAEEARGEAQRERQEVQVALSNTESLLQQKSKTIEWHEAAIDELSRLASATGQILTQLLVQKHKY